MKLQLPIVFTLVFFLTAPAILAEAGVAAAAGSSLSVRTFPLRHKEAGKAAAAIKSLISAEGSVSIQPANNTLVVTDRTENLKKVAELLQKFDATSKSFKVSIRLVAASRVPSDEAKVPRELKEVSEKLSGMLRFNSFENLGEILAEGSEGDNVVCELQSGYHADFRFGEYDSASDSVRIGELQLSKLQPIEGGEAALTKLFKTSLNLKVGQTVILGASRAPQSQKALMIVLVARKIE